MVDIVQYLRYICTHDVWGIGSIPVFRRLVLIVTIIMRSLHDVHEMNAHTADHVCLPVCPSIRTSVSLG
jgi:hypothetical protein